MAGPELSGISGGHCTLIFCVCSYEYLLRILKKVLPNAEELKASTMKIGIPAVSERCC